MLRQTVLKTAAVWLVALASGSVCFTVPALGGSTADARTCTVFAATYGGKTYFGSNLDHPNTGSSLWFWPASEGQYGGVLLGYHGRVGDELMIGYEGGMNDRGLAFDTLGLPDAPMIAHPEKPTSWNTDNFWRKMLRECADVDEAVAMAKSFDFGEMLDFQTLVTDSTGAAVVMGPGPDGELGLTIKARGEGHIVATNFNLANPEHHHDPYPCPRHETVTEMLARFEAGADFTLAHARDILDAVHREGASYNTIFSYVADPHERVLYLYYFHQFDEVVALDLDEELSRGERELEIRTLFSQRTRDRAAHELARYQTSGSSASTAILTVVLAAVSTLAVFTVVGVARHRKKRRREHP